MMSKEQFEREKNYRVFLAIVKSMLKKGVITDDDYFSIDTMLVAKYHPITAFYN